MLNCRYGMLGWILALWLAPACVGCSGEDSAGGKTGKDSGAGGGSGGVAGSGGTGEGGTPTGAVRATMSYSGSETGTVFLQIDEQFPLLGPPAYVEFTPSPVFPLVVDFKTVAAGNWQFFGFLATLFAHNEPRPQDPSFSPIAITVNAGETLDIEAEFIDPPTDGGIDGDANGGADSASDGQSD